jgi:hypothetical protein
MRGIPYGSTPLCALTFCLSHPARRFAVLHAARHGYVHALDIQREFTDYNRSNARDLLYVLKTRGVMRPDKTIPDVQGKNKQLTYVLTEQAREGIRDLLACATELDQLAWASAPRVRTCSNPRCPSFARRFQMEVTECPDCRAHLFTFPTEVTDETHE